MKVYLEVGQRRTFACAVDWPGWCRAGKTPDDALQALLDYAPRYAAALGIAVSELKPPSKTGGFDVIERLDGNATTDFGAPGVIPVADQRRASASQIDELITILEASWSAFDRAATSAHGRKLGPSGPRGGGRELAKMAEHVAGADVGYTNAVGGKVAGGESAPWPQAQAAMKDAIRARARGELPDRGPRGGARWPARYAIRRSAWHALDHAWEVEDRVITTREKG